MSDLISRQAILDKAINIPIAKIVTEDKIIYRRVVFVDEIEQMPSAEKTGHWIDGLIAKVLEEVDGGTDDTYIRYADICNRVEKSIREYCGAKMESEDE